MRKPRIITRCVANAYAGPNERIIEFSASDSADVDLGGLIRFTRDGDTLSVHVYRCGPGVRVSVSTDSKHLVT